MYQQCNHTGRITHFVLLVSLQTINPRPLYTGDTCFFLTHSPESWQTPYSTVDHLFLQYACPDFFPASSFNLISDKNLKVLTREMIPFGFLVLLMKLFRNWTSEVAQQVKAFATRLDGLDWISRITWWSKTDPHKLSFDHKVSSTSDLVCWSGILPQHPSTILLWRQRRLDSTPNTPTPATKCKKLQQLGANCQ